MAHPIVSRWAVCVGDRAYALAVGSEAGAGDGGLLPNIVPVIFNSSWLCREARLDMFG